MNFNHSDTPTFNLKAVVQETGLKPDTLRAWERRYGLPQPDRSDGGHRLYSQRDIEILKWLTQRQQEGLSISRAVELWHRLESEGQDPLVAVSPTPPATPTHTAFVPTGETISDLRQAWVTACISFAEQQAEQILTQASALYSPEVVCFELLQKGLAEVGQKWAAGEITVQQEHFASSLAMRRLEALVAATPPPTRPGRMLVGCPPEELHTFSLLLATFLLRRHGWEATYLGARIPLTHMEETIESVKPNLVILGAQQLYTAATLFEMAQTLKEKEVPLAFGGRIFTLLPDLQRHIPGHFLGDRLDQIPHKVEKILATPYASPPVKPVPQTSKQALVHYRENQGLIEAAVWEQMRSTAIIEVVLTYWNLTTSRNIAAALTLGDINFLGDQVGWGQEMLVNYSLPEETLHQYLEAYHQAAKAHLNQKGQPILNWFEQVQ